ncbi:hypothetical protein ACFLTM_05975 [Candidatus Bipolaricaulota bacterium]
MKSAERAFSSAYLERLRQLFDHVVDIPVQYRRGHLPKYRLIHGTQSVDGLILMADTMSRVWRAFVNRDRGGQGALFEEIDYPDMVILEGYCLEDDILDMSIAGCDLKDLIARLIGRYGITFPEAELKKRVKAMGARGDLTISRDPPLTPKTRQPSTSMDYNRYRIRIERTPYG